MVEDLFLDLFGILGERFRYAFRRQYFQINATSIRSFTEFFNRKKSSTEYFSFLSLDFEFLGNFIQCHKFARFLHLFEMSQEIMFLFYGNHL